MSNEISVGDFRTNQDGIEFEVIAIDGKFLWAKWEDAVPPMTQTLSWAEKYTKPKPNFFEKNATYRNIHTDNKWTVWHVPEMANGKVAVAQDANGIPIMFTQENWDSGRYKKV